jgi:hypothetical protein
MRRIDHRLGLAFLTGVFIGSLVAACGGDTATPRVGPTAPPEAAASRSHGPQGDFVMTGSMTMGRDSQMATLLPDGRVLIAGGEPYNGARTNEARTADLYDPKTGTFVETGSLVASHLLGTATLLLDGRVLIVGGWELRDGFTMQPPDLRDRFLSASAELYDPKTGKFTRTGSLAQARCSHSATRLQDGRVLIAGGVIGADGDPNDAATALAEIYDPATGKFTATGSMTTPRWHHSATLLNDGSVLVTASWADPSAELYDPVKGEFIRTESMKIIRGPHLATLLRDGRVLIVGDGESFSSSSTAEIYDPGTGQFSSTGSMLHMCNIRGTYNTLTTAPLLPDGRVLVPDATYLGFGSDVSGVELYDPATGTFTQGPQMTRYRSGFSATLLADGRVLFAGNSAPVYPMDMVRPTDSVTLAGIEVDRATAEIFVP